jgi:hypothetical protein
MRDVPHRHVVAPWLAVQTHRDWWLALGIPAIVLAVALMWPHIGWWSLGVALAAYGCGYLAYERYQATRALTVTMARTLGRLAELGGASTPGHAERSSTVAVAVGRRLGLEDTALGTVEHAARAAHVGRVGLDRPADARVGFDPITVAEWSAAILRRAPGLAGAADAVAPVSPDPNDPVLGSVRSVVQVAAAFDEASSGNGLAADEALAMASGTAPDDSDDALRALGEIFGVVRA